MQQIHCRAWIEHCCNKRVKLAALSNSGSAENSRLIIQEKEYVIEHEGYKYINLYHYF